MLLLLISRFARNAHLENIFPIPGLLRLPIAGCAGLGPTPLFQQVLQYPLAWHAFKVHTQLAPELQEVRLA